MIHGCDLYHGDPMVDVTKFDFVFHKATQGTWFTDPVCQERIAQVRDAGKLAGMYHFMTTTDPIQAQFDYFIKQSNPQPGDVLALDFENDGHWPSLTSLDLVNMANTFMRLLAELVPSHRSLLYCDKTDWANIVVPFGVFTNDGPWIASPGSEPVGPQRFWQYGSDIVDYDRGYFASLQEAKDWANGFVPIVVGPNQQKLQLED